MLKKILLVVLVLLAMALPASAQDVARATVVGVDDVTVVVGQEFTVPVRIAGVRDLYAYDVRLPHDRAILQGVRVDHGGWLIPGFVIRQGFYEWGGRLGAAVAVYGVLSMAGLILAREFGYGAQTAPLVSLGVVAIAVVVAWGALQLLVGGWRRPGPASTGSGANGGDD